MDPDPLSFQYINLQAFVPVLSDYILTALLLLFIISNAIISGSEVAFFTVERNFSDDIHTSDEPKKISISNLLRKPEKLSASIVIAYNLLNVSITVLIIYLLNRLPFFGGDVVETLLLEVIISICVVLLFVNILPKLYASHNPLRFASNNVYFIYFINRLMSPASSLLVKSTSAISPSSKRWKHEISVDDLSKALEITSNDITRDQEKEMLEGIIRFKDKTVDDILVSRGDMIAIDLQTPFKEVIDFIVDAGFSRIPVFDENPDNIKGILYVKDLLPHLGKPNNFRWQSLIRSAYFVPGTKRIDDLLEEFRSSKIHMAVVVDEYGGTSGLVTMEDILEEIVGDISDEYDEELRLYTIAADGSYIFEGKTPLEEFIKITGLPEKDFEEMAEEVGTLAGLLLELKGDFPKRKESFIFKKHTFLAEEMSKKRITKVRYIPPKIKKTD
ncbi:MULTISPECIES: gliding motility-associated protein GldE [Proteiniphilum]|uniref:gliding motility-associated protein GldE n=1 Tax=Proteiniphilum TaxID=294702 RepID=UPI001EEA21B6|nr:MULTISPECIES: gliding motility-associated protein GldE [Proteiniphilum]ULB35344.1 gliding motility-associated protein GldE [Proteiniphilum propionicum]